MSNQEKQHERKFAMKHRPTRMLCALLACLMLLGSAASLFGCASSSEQETTAAADNASSTSEEVVETSTEYNPNIEKKNYNTTFNVITGGFNKELLFIDDESRRDGNSLDEAIYERGALIKDHLGVEWVIADAGSWTEYSGKVKATVNTGDDAYQLVLTYVYQGITDLITSNCLMSFSDLPAFNMDAPYWNSNLMEDLKIEGKYLLGYSDFLLAKTHCVVFNKDTLQDYQLEQPYALVNNKTWTVDKLFEMASAVSRDNGDGTWTVDDYYGISGWRWVPLISLITSCDMKIVDKDAETGKYYVAYDDYTKKLSSLVDKVSAMCKAEYSYMWPATNYTALDFSNGHSLFQLLDTKNLQNLAAQDVRFGVLPYPLYDEAQEEYRSLNWNGMMTVPASVANNGDPDMVGEVLELLAYYSDGVKTAFYELQLGAKVAEAQEDADMLDIIWDSIVSDVGLICCASSSGMEALVYMLPRLCSGEKTNLTSFIKSNRRKAQNGLDDVFGQ